MEASPAERWSHGRELFRGLKVRAIATVGLLAGGLVWVILYLAFLASPFAWYQNLAVILSTFIVGIAILVGMWIVWGFGVARRFHDWATDSTDW